MGENGDTWCVHRTPFDREKHPLCKAGIDYYQFRGAEPALGWIDHMPCIGKTPEARARCEKYHGRTPEEIEAEEREWKAAFGRVTLGLKAIREATGRKRGVSGSIPCPTCSKPLHYSVAASNGHVHAQCETPDCTGFMQ